jgi:hypothetical protein
VVGDQTSGGQKSGDKRSDVQRSDGQKHGHNRSKQVPVYDRINFDLTKRLAGFSQKSQNKGKKMQKVKLHFFFSYLRANKVQTH